MDLALTFTNSSGQTWEYLRLKLWRKGSQKKANVRHPERGTGNTFIQRRQIKETNKKKLAADNTV